MKYDLFDWINQTHIRDRYKLKLHKRLLLIGAIIFIISFVLNIYLLSINLIYRNRNANLQNDVDHYRTELMAISQNKD